MEPIKVSLTSKEGVNVQRDVNPLSKGQVEKDYIHSLEQQVVYLKRENRFLKRELDNAYETLRARFEAEFDEKRQELIDKHDAEHRNQRQAFEARFRRLRIECEKANAEADQLAQARQELDRANADLEARLQRLEQGTSESDQVLAQTQRHNEQLRSENREQTRIIAELRESLNDYIPRVEQLEDELSRRNDERSDFHSWRASILQELEELRNAAVSDSAESWRRRCDELQKEVNHLEAELRRSESAGQQASRALEEALDHNALLANQSRELQGINSNTSRKLTDMERERKELAARIAELESVMTRVTSDAERTHQSESLLNQRHEEVKRLLVQREAQIEDLEQQLYELRESRAGSTTTIKRFEDAIRRLTDENVALKRDLRDLQNQQTSQEAASQKEMDRMHRKNADLEHKLALLQRLRNIPWTDVEQMATVMKDFSHTMNDYSSNIDEDAS